MTDPPLHVLFVCTGNSARSILAESLLNRLGAGRFVAHSAGSHPRGAVHPLALELLGSRGLPTDGLSSKGWEAFTGPQAPPVGLVITVCDNAAGEGCPAFPGSPARRHWSIPDPAAVEGDPPARRAAFRRAFEDIENRVRALVGSPG